MFYKSGLCIPGPWSWVKVHIFWEGHKILRNLHQSFVLGTASQMISQNFVAFSEYMNFIYFNISNMICKQMTDLIWENC